MHNEKEFCSNESVISWCEFKLICIIQTISVTLTTVERTWTQKTFFTCTNVVLHPIKMIN